MPTVIMKFLNYISAPVDYLPPVTEYLAPAELADATETSPLGDDGYEYRTVRRLKLRHRRDVSHLAGPARQYLPPSNLYLPPLPTVASTVAPAPALAPAPVDDTEEVISAAEPKVNREYLPPSTEAPVEVETEAAPDAPTEVPEVHSAQLLDDGYHYKQPNEQPAELREAAPREYLPPVAAEDEVPPVEEEEVVVVEGPSNGESAVLTKDGYQYRRVALGSGTSPGTVTGHHHRAVEGNTTVNSAGGAGGVV
ncbi:uncharacterized protein Dwil_GK27552 [Drosophila willistoni]|uniref:Uncharacterized protein n=1 Tax=Drosophila willistoni TaxID=7260 RepID=A0A0Q9WPW9_DROWI|nr:uncharacterized protein Dwil_GK27552 [Drosophila willistoni]